MVREFAGELVLMRKELVLVREFEVEFTGELVLMREFAGELVLMRKELALVREFAGELVLLRKLGELLR